MSPSSSDIGDEVSVGVEGGWRSYCGSPLTLGFSGVLSLTSPFATMLRSNVKEKKHVHYGSKWQTSVPYFNTGKVHNHYNKFTVQCSNDGKEV